MTQPSLPRPAAEDPESAKPPFYPFPRAAGCPFDPPPRLAELREHEPISPVRVWGGMTAWLVTRHRDHRAILADHRFSADPRRPGYPTQGAGGAARGERGERPLPFNLMDDPEHNRIRRMFTAHFSVKRVRAMRPRLEEIISDLLDGVEAMGPPADLVSEFALPLPSLVIAEILGVPRADQPLFQRESSARSSTAATMEEVLASTDALTEYLHGLVELKRREPADDLISHLIRNQLEPGAITADQLVQDAILLLIAGHETTTSMVALGTLRLLREPAQLAVIRDAEDPAVIARAVEELLRFLSIVHIGRPRVATEDVEINGHLIRAGEGVVLTNDAANRDPAVFGDPERFDLTRPDARRHLAFGQGTHQCLGQNLARLELQLAFPALLRRFPDLRPAIEEKDIRYKSESIVYGVHELPVTW